MRSGISRATRANSALQAVIKSIGVTHTDVASGSSDQRDVTLVTDRVLLPSLSLFGLR